MSTELELQLEKISSVLYVDNLLKEKMSNEITKSYYKTNRVAYRIFHNFKGYLHMGLSSNGEYKPSDLEVPLLHIEEHIKQLDAKSVLELASGHGANSVFLAQRNSNVLFHALDLSTKPKKAFYRLENTQFEHGDFHNLSSFDDNSLDLVFIIEALCSASDKTKVINEVARVLKKGGRFIILDGYYSRPISELDTIEQKATKLTSVGLAVGEFMYLGEFNSLIESSSFTLLTEEDLSSEVLPTMDKFGRLAKAFFRLGRLANFLQRFLPDMFVRNSIPGLLMPTLVREGIAKYYRHVLIKD